MGKAIVIGAAGFLGRQLCRILLNDGQEVLPVVHETPLPGWSGPQLRLEQVEELDAEGAVVYLLAAKIPYGAMNVFSPELVAVNVALPLRIAERFTRSRLVYASSVSVYGAPLAAPVTESHPFNQPAAYGMSKLAGEVAVSAHPDHAILRFSSLYGAGMVRSTFLPAILNSARTQGKITLYGSGSRRQDYLHVSDAARMLAAAGAGSGPGVFNAVCGRACSNREVAESIRDMIDGVTLTYVGEDPTPDSIYSNERWCRAFPDFVYEFGELRQGLKEMCGND